MYHVHAIPVTGNNIPPEVTIGVIISSSRMLFMYRWKLSFDIHCFLFVRQTELFQEPHTLICCFWLGRKSAFVRSSELLLPRHLPLWQRLFRTKPNSISQQHRGRIPRSFCLGHYPQPQHHAQFTKLSQQLAAAFLVVVSKSQRQPVQRGLSGHNWPYGGWYKVTKCSSWCIPKRW